MSNNKILKRPAPRKVCPKCEAKIHVRYRICPNCGHTIVLHPLKTKEPSMLYGIRLARSLLEICKSREKAIEFLIVLEKLHENKDTE